jgi:Cyanate permease
MSDFQASTTFNEKLRRIRFRRNREKTRFRDELRIIPKWLIVALIVVFLGVQAGCLIGNLGFKAMSSPHGEVWPYPNDPALSGLAVAGIVTAASIPLSAFFLLVGYVNRDARRRGMNSTLWTILVVILSGGWLMLGFFIYFLMREPLPYNCPQCGTTVGARFNYCPNCKCNLRPSCPQCKREVGELDKFCPYCATELNAANVGGTVAPPPAPPDFRGVL